MKTTIALLIFLFVSPSFAAIDGSSIKNAHIIYDDGQAQLIRGKAPSNEKQIIELLDLGVTEFLIFKIDTKGEVAKEQIQLRGLGVPSSSITHVAFPWKDVNDFSNACEMTITALKVMQEAAENGRRLYFHCTVGEDRTGYLAGLFSLWVGTYSSAKEALDKELCARGYEAGNPDKPYRDVVLKIRETLTPTYFKMANLLLAAKERGEVLDFSMCDREPRISVQPDLHYCASSK